MRNYRSVANRNANMVSSAGGINAEYWQELEVLKTLNNSADITQGIPINVISSTYGQPGLAIADYYSTGGFYANMVGNRAILDINGNPRDLNNLTVDFLTLNVGYTDEEITLGGIRARNILASRTAGQSTDYITSVPTRYISNGNGAHFLPQVGVINLISLYAEIFVSGESGEKQIFMLRQFKTEPFTFTATHGCITMITTRRVKGH